MAGVKPVSFVMSPGAAQCCRTSLRNATRYIPQTLLDKNLIKRSWWYPRRLMKGDRKACCQLVLESLVEVHLYLFPKRCIKPLESLLHSTAPESYSYSKTIVSSPLTSRTRKSIGLQHMILFQQLSCYLTQTLVNDVHGNDIKMRQLDHTRITAQITSYLDRKSAESVMIHQRATVLSRCRFLQLIYS